MLRVFYRRGAARRPFFRRKGLVESIFFIALIALISWYVTVAETLGPTAWKREVIGAAALLVPGLGPSIAIPAQRSRGIFAALRAE